MTTPNTCCNTTECKHESKQLTAQLQISLAEQFTNDDATNTTTRTSHAIQFELPMQYAAVCNAERRIVSTPFPTYVAGQIAISEGHAFSATGPPEPPRPPMPPMAKPAFTITGINLRPNSNNCPVCANIAYLPPIPNFHPLNALGLKQPALHFH